jgi:hypothetical protein
MKRRFERLQSELINPDNQLVFIRKESTAHNGRNLNRDEIVNIRDTLRRLVPTEKHFTFHMISYHDDQSLTFQRIETIKENNCTLEWDSFPHHPEAYGHSHAWSAFLEHYTYVEHGTKPIIPYGVNPVSNW